MATKRHKRQTKPSIQHLTPLIPLVFLPYMSFFIVNRCFCLIKWNYGSHKRTSTGNSRQGSKRA